jgi:hypothetical protein
MENKEATRLYHFNEGNYNALNAAVINGVELNPTDVADRIVGKLELVPENDYNVWIDFTQEEFECLALLLQLGVKELGEDFFAEGELRTIQEFVDEV